LDNIACASQFQFTCGQTVGNSAVVDIDTNAGLNARTSDGTRCLIHARNNLGGQGQDSFSQPNPNSSPIVIDGGDNNPNPVLQGVTNISRSDSIVTVPVYDHSNATPGSLILCPVGGCGTTQIVGFLQLGIQQTDAGQGQFDAVIMNAVGCPPSPAGDPISGGGVSPVPVRLIGQ
jgi:hypothetical protein